MIDTKKLNIALIETGKTKRELARALGLSEMGLYKKLLGQTEFKASEIVKLREALNLSAPQIYEIFFTV